MNIRKELENALGAAQHIQLNDLELDPLKIRAILINEAVPCDPSQDFYGRQDAAYLSTTIPLFQKAGFKVQSIQDIGNLHYQRGQNTENRVCNCPKHHRRQPALSGKGTGPVPQ